MVRSQFRDSQKLSSVSIVVPDLLFEASELHNVELPNVARRIRDLISGAGLNDRVWMGIIDISLNISPAPEREERWSYHCMLITTELTRHFARKLKRTIRRDPQVPRPVKVTAIYYLNGISKYVAKPTFVKRVSYLSKKGKRNTKKYPLSGRPLSELNLSLCRFRHENRLVLINLRRNGNALLQLG